MKISQFQKNLIIALTIAAASGAVTLFSAWIIPKINPNPVPLEDFLFKITPFVFWTKYVSDILILTTIGLMAFYLFPKRKYLFPQAVAIVCTMYFLRGILLFLTPIGPPGRDYLYYGDKSFLINGFFPSGHTAFVFICYLLIDKKGAPIIKNILLGALVVEIITLILSRSHYSIDIAIGLLLGYFVFDLYKKQKWLEAPNF